jgi:hypothetical protein
VGIIGFLVLLIILELILWYFQNFNFNLNLNFDNLVVGMEAWDPILKKSRRYVVETLMAMIRVISEVVRMWMGLELCGVLSHVNGGEGSRRLRRRGQKKTAMVRNTNN